MSDCTMAQAKRDFERGILTHAWITSLEFSEIAGPAWIVLLEGSGLGGKGWLLDARHGKPRQFKTLDAAASAIRQIGFKVESLRVGQV